MKQSLTEQRKIQRSELFLPGLRYLEADDQQKAAAVWDKPKVTSLTQSLPRKSLKTQQCYEHVKFCPLVTSKSPLRVSAVPR